MGGNRVERPSRMAIARGLTAICVAVGAFATANLIARLAVAGLDAVGLTAGPGILVSVLTFQGLGVVVVIVAFLRVAGLLADWRSYLRLERLTMETVLHGSVVAFVSVVVLGVWTAVAGLAGATPAEPAGSERSDPAYFVALFLASTLVAAPMEEAFFRGLLQRYLTDRLGQVVAITVASLLFVLIHTGVLGGEGARLVTFGVFASLGVVLGLAYHYTENLFVPLTSSHG